MTNISAEPRSTQIPVHAAEPLFRDSPNLVRHDKRLAWLAGSAAWEADFRRDMHAAGLR